MLKCLANSVNSKHAKNYRMEVNEADIPHDALIRTIPMWTQGCG